MDEQSQDFEQNHCVRNIHPYDRGVIIDSLIFVNHQTYIRLKQRVHINGRSNCVSIRSKKSRQEPRKYNINTEIRKVRNIHLAFYHLSVSIHNVIIFIISRLFIFIYILHLQGEQLRAGVALDKVVTLSKAFNCILFS